MKSLGWAEPTNTSLITVTVGFWLGHERHGFDYSDKAQVAAQLESAREMVLKYKDHPALLMWGVGNEMEGFDDGNNPAIWKAVNDVAAMIKHLEDRDVHIFRSVEEI